MKTIVRKAVAKSLKSGKAPKPKATEAAVQSIAFAARIAIATLFHSCGVVADEKKVLKMMKPPPRFLTRGGGRASGGASVWYVAVYDSEGNFAGWVECSSRGQAHAIGQAAVANGASYYAVSTARPAS